MPQFKFIKFLLLGLVPALAFGADDINITYPNVGILYESDGNGMQVQWNYQSQSNDIQSLSWAYKLDGGSYSSPITGTDSVNGSTWLSGLTADGGSHTLYVALLDQNTGSQLTTDSHSFTYQSGSSGTQSGTGDSISIQDPSHGDNVNSSNDDLKISYTYSSANGGSSYPVKWAYKLYDPSYGTPFSSYSSNHGGTQVDYTDTKNGFMSGLSDGQYTVYVTLLDSTGAMFNPPITDHVSFNYQSSGGSVSQSPDGISIYYPNVGILYESDGNGMQVQWNYQSQSNDIQSLSWAYKLDGGSYSSPITGTDSVNGSTWLSGLTADGGSHTLYVALLDQNTGSQLTTDSHSFTYQSGSSGTQSGTGDSISIQDPSHGDNVNSSNDDLKISYTYSSANGGSSYPVKWAYKLYDPSYGTPFSSYSSNHGGTQVDYTDTKNGFMSGLSDGQYTVYVTLLDSTGAMFNPPITDHVSFNYQSSGGSVSQSPDGISIYYPNVGILYESDGNGMQVQWNYQSQSNDIQSLSWAYKLDGGSYSSPITGTDSVNGSTWLSGLTADGGSHTLYVALLDQNTGSQLTTDSHSFTYQSGSSGTQSGTGDSISIQDPSHGDNVNSSNDDLKISYTYSSANGGSSYPVKWAYKLYDPSYGTPFSSYSSNHGGTQVDYTDTKNGFMSGLSDGQYTVYVTLLDSTGAMFNPPITDHVSFNYQSSGGSVSQSPDGISIYYPNVGILYESDGNGMQVQWNYQSQSNDIQSLSWAYKLDGGSYSSPITGTDSVNGSTWLSGLTADGGSHTLYVALLDQNTGSQLTTDSHSFTYQSGSSGTQSGTGDSISIQDPSHGDNVNSSNDDLKISYTYSSANGGSSYPVKWAYKLYDPSYGTPFSSYSSNHGGTQVDYTDTKNGFMSGLSDGQYTVYVTLLDSTGAMFNPPITDHVSFNYQSSGGSVSQSPDGISIYYPNVGILYESDGNGMQVQWNYQSQSNDIQSLSWAYKLDGGSYSSPITGTDSVNGSTWLSGLTADGGSHTLYVALLDQNTGSQLTTDSHSFTYQSGSSGTQSGTGDSISIQDPSHGDNVNSSNDDLKISYTYSSANGGSSYPVKWAYKLYDPSYGTPFSSYSSNHGGTQVDYTDTKNGFMSGLSDGSYTVYVTLLDSTGDMLNPPITDHVSFNYQSSGGSVSQSPDGISIYYPNVGILYESDGNGMQVQWNYQSQSNDIQSLSWAYKLDGGSYSSPITGTDSVNGSTWLSGLTADGGSHTLYVALLDQNTGSQLTTDSHSFTYQSGSSGTQSGTGDSISIQDPSHGDNVNSSNDDLKISYTYSSANGGSSYPVKWAYKLYDPSYGTPFSSYSSNHGGTQVDYTDTKNGFMSGLSDGSYTVYVTLLDSTGDMLNPPITDHVSFNYQSSGGSVSQSPDGISIYYPNVGILYESDGNGMQVQWNYQSQSNDIQSLSWAYKLDGGSYSSPITGTDSVNGSTWLSGLTADGGSHTLYVALLDQNTGSQLTTDSHSFTYQSGSSGTQSGTGDSISIQDPSHGDNVNSSNDDLKISYTYSSANGGSSYPVKWAYKLYDPSYGTPFSSYSSNHGGTQVDYTDTKNGFMSGLSDGQYTVYVTLLDSTGAMFNPPITDHVSFNYQSSTGGTQSGGSGHQSPDGISIYYPNVGILYESDGNGMQVQWNYQSQSNDIQSLSWAYKLDGGSYSSPITGTDSVNGSTWLSGLTADGGSHTLYVALLDQNTGSQLTTDSHSFTYQSGSSGTQSGTGDSISIQDPSHGDNVNSSNDDLKISYTYSSANGGSSYPVKWAYKLYDPSYGTPFSSYSSNHGGTQVDYTDTKNGFMSGLSDGQYTVYVTLLDSTGAMFNPPITDHVSFNYQSSTGGTQSGGSGHQSPDGISIYYPNVGILYESDGNGMQVQWNYQSQSNDIQSLSWAYKLDGGSYSSPITGTNSVPGSTWLSGLTADGGSHTLYVALLDQNTGSQLTTDSHSFTYQSGSSGTQSGGGATQSPGGGYQTSTGSYSGPTEWKFTNAGAVGSYGPTQSQVDSNYSGTSLDGQVTINTQGIQKWNVPTNGTYKIEVFGAGGGSYFYNQIGGLGGLGAKMVGEFTFSKDDQLKILVGQQGESLGSSSINASGPYGGAGGGGGTFVIGSSNLLIAGGGGSGAAGGNDSNPGLDGNISTTGGAGLARSSASASAGGADGYAGSQDTTYSQRQDPGAGYLESSTNSLTYGSATSGAKSFADGGAGQNIISGSNYGSGGYGGASAGNERKGGAGGGYSGGGTISTAGSAHSFGVAGGGGSYNSGANQYNESGVNSGHGQVIITLISLNNNPSTGDSISIQDPYHGENLDSSTDDLKINYTYSSANGGSSSPPKWAYKLYDPSYGTPFSSYSSSHGGTQVDYNDSKHGFMSGQPTGSYTVYVTLLDSTGAMFNPPITDHVSFDFDAEEHHGNPPYFLFSTNDLSSFASGVSLTEGNYTILKEQNATDSQTFKLAKVYRDLNGYLVVDTTLITESSISFAELETYLDTNKINELGYVDFMPFDFRAIARIDLNQSTEILSLATDFDEIFYQEFIDSKSGNTYWALSIEEDDGNESNNSNLVVDMAGFVYDGHFEDYWYHAFGIAAYMPNTEPEQKHADWNETSFGISDVNISKLYSDYPQIGRPQLFFTKTNFNMTENNDFNLTLDSLSLSLPKLLGDLNYSVSSISQSGVELPLSVDQNGNIIIHNKVYYDNQNQITFNVAAFDQFDRNITDQITITVEREPLLPIVQTIGHQINSNGIYTLTGKLLSKGGVPLSSLGFQITGKGFSQNEQLSVNLNTAEGAEFSVSLGTRTVDGANTYIFTTYAGNEEGLSFGAARKFTTEDPSSWTDGADDLDGGWKSHWFGIFLPQPNGWSYHLDLGWAFISPDSDGGIWFWKDGRGWNWTKEDLWPFMWSNKTSGWMYMVKGSSRLLIFDYSTDSYITDF